jgi:hypothetical protein
MAALYTNKGCLMMIGERELLSLDWPVLVVSAHAEVQQLLVVLSRIVFLL